MIRPRTARTVEKAGPGPYTGPHRPQPAARNRSTEHDHDDHRNPQGNTGLPGRSEAAAAADDPLAVLEQGDLPARAGLQRRRCRRQAAVRGAEGPEAAGGRPQPAHPHRLRRRRAHDHHRRQRHRHEPRRGRRAPGHHRQVRHGRVPARPQRRPEEGRQPDRPVRRGLLQRLHRGRPRGRVQPSRRPARQRGRALVQRGRR